MRVVRTLFTLALVLVAATALANPAVDAGKRLYDDLEYKKALKQFEKALKQDLAPEERATALQYLGLTQATLNDLAGAAGTFKQLLELKPDFELDRSSTPPKILDLFEKVRSTMPKPKVTAPPPKASELVLTHVAPSEARPGRAIDLPLTLTDPDHRAAVVIVRFRRHGDASWQELKLTAASGSLVAQLPGMVVQSPSIEYYIAAQDANGEVLTTVASEAEPMVVPVREPAKPQATPVYRRWWFWTILAAGVVAIGTATAVAVAVTSGGGSSGGTAPVTITFTP